MNWGNEDYGQAGVFGKELNTLNTIPELEGLPVKHVYAGRYYSIAVVEEDVK